MIAATVLVVVTVSAAAWAMWPAPAPATAAPPVTTGVAVIDAVPFGTVTAIRAADGTLMPLPDDPVTPLQVALPEGEYDITVNEAQGGGQSKTVRVTVRGTGIAVAPIVQFTTITADEYFEPYLSADDGDSAPARASIATTDSPEGQR